MVSNKVVDSSMIVTYLATLAACHTVLLLLAELSARELSLLLAGLDLVAHGIELVALEKLVNDR